MNENGAKKHPRIRRRTRKEREIVQRALEQFFNHDQSILVADSDGYLPLCEVARFTHTNAELSKLSRRAKVILGEKSSVFEVNLDASKVRARVPRLCREEQSIYVDNLPSYANSSWLSAVFGKYGTILNTYIPASRVGQPNRGSAFIQFASDSSATLACKAFERVKHKKPQTSQTDEPKPKKRCRRRKRRKLRSALTVKAKSPPELVVMAVPDWRKLRNEYLSLQKESMAKLKQEIRGEKITENDFTEEWTLGLRGREKLSLRASIIQEKRRRIE